jgi:hypothetical protein
MAGDSARTIPGDISNYYEDAGNRFVPGSEIGRTPLFWDDKMLRYSVVFYPISTH